MIKRLIRRIISWAASDEIRGEPISSNSSFSKSHPGVSNNSKIGDGNNGMNFTVYSAVGGKVIQFVSYDPARDRVTSNLYVITEKEDLGDELGQIITKESLSR